MINAQEWLDKEYPVDQRSETTELDISSKNLRGSLDLNDFTNLEELVCYGNQLEKLEVSNLVSLKELICPDNQLTQLDLTNCDKLEKLNCSYNFLRDLKLPFQVKHLTELNVGSNNFPEQDLLMFSYLVNLESLWIGNGNDSHVNKEKKARAKKRISRGIYNRFSGSLEPLQILSKLKTLTISNTDIDSGLEYLPKSVEYFSCLADLRDTAKCQTIYNLLSSNRQLNNWQWLIGRKNEWVENFSQKLRNYKQKVAKNQTHQQFFEDRSQTQRQQSQELSEKDRNKQVNVSKETCVECGKKYTENVYFHRNHIRYDKSFGSFLCGECREIGKGLEFAIVEDRVLNRSKESKLLFRARDKNTNIMIRT